MPQIRATDFHQYIVCDRKVYLGHHGDPALRLPLTAHDQLIMQQGQAHETSVMETVLHVRPEYEVIDLPAGFRETLRLMREGAPVIAQGVLMHDDLVGIPDVLRRIEVPSALGDHAYEPVDIKLSTRQRDGHALQVMAYIAMLEAIQGMRPQGALWLRPPVDAPPGSFVEHPVEFDEERYTARLAQVRSAAGGIEPPPFFSSECGSCIWRAVCVPLVQDSSDISLIPRMQRRVWLALRERGVRRLGQLAALEPRDILDIKGVGDKTARSYIDHARAFTHGKPILRGRPDLPEGDVEVYFDIESAPAENVYYLMGFLVHDGSGTHFEHELASRPVDEGAMWARFLDRVDMLGGAVYHYGSFERRAIAELVGRYGADLRAEALLERMIDLEVLLRTSAVLPLPSYSLKSVAPWLGHTWSGETTTADESIVAYTRWLESGDAAHLESVLLYNEDDCRATLRIKEWLATLPVSGD